VQLCGEGEDKSHLKKKKQGGKGKPKLIGCCCGKKRWTKANFGSKTNVFFREGYEGIGRKKNVGNRKSRKKKNVV